MVHYNTFLTALRSQTEEISFHGIQPDQILSTFRQVLREHPELFWVKSGCEWTEVGCGQGISVQFHPRYYRTPTENRKKALAVDDAVYDILVRMQPGLSDWDKALYIHDWIVNNTDYNTIASRLPGDVIGTTDYFDSYNVCGVLLDHSAVCAGYARAFQLLAQRVGLECLRVVGTGREEGLHEWNIIRLGGNYYHVDVTWDDPVFEGQKKTVCRHDYFCVPTREILLTHGIDEGQSLPICTDETADYYRKNGLFFAQYSYLSVARVIAKHAALGSVELKFGSRAEVEKAQEDLIKRERFFLIQGISGRYRSICYSVSSSKLVLCLEWSR